MPMQTLYRYENRASLNMQNIGKNMWQKLHALSSVSWMMENFDYNWNFSEDVSIHDMLAQWSMHISIFACEHELVFCACIYLFEGRRQEYLIRDAQYYDN